MPTSESASASVLILAAGQGKRMRSSLPKVLTPISGEPMIFHILDKVSEVLPQASVGIVVGHQAQEVKEAISKESRFGSLDIHFIEQKVRDGTGGAARVAMESSWGEKAKELKRPVLVLPGDLPLITRALVEQMCEPLKKSTPIRMLSAEIEDPAGYGRVIRKGKLVQKVVEHKDASSKELKVKEVAASIYLFSVSFLSSGVKKIKNNNAQKEYYLPDLVSQAIKAKKKVEPLLWPEPRDIRGVNDTWELAEASHYLNQRILKSWSDQGVKFFDPKNTWVEVAVKLSEGVEVSSGVHLYGNTSIGEDTTLGPNVVLKNTQVGARVEIKAGTVSEDSSVSDGAKLGPYAHLRPGSEIGEEAKIGNFVEVKKSSIGKATSVAHLSYVGDAQVGDGVNIGCGFVTCNYDGRVIDGQRKHKTIIEDGVFVGSDCQTVAPVTIGKGAFVASGSTVTKNVSPDALAFARARQVEKAGYAKKLRAQSENSEASSSTKNVNVKPQ